MKVTDVYQQDNSYKKTWMTYFTINKIIYIIRKKNIDHVQFIESALTINAFVNLWNANVNIINENNCEMKENEKVKSNENFTCYDRLAIGVRPKARARDWAEGQTWASTDQYFTLSPRHSLGHVMSSH